MKKNRWFLRMMVLLLLSGILSMTIALAAEPGSDGDPLVTLSYLNDTFMKSVMDKVDQKISARNSQLAQQLRSDQRRYRHGCHLHCGDPLQWTGFEGGYRL